MVAAETTPAHNPGEGAFDDPSSGQGAKAWWEELIPLDLLSFGHQQTALGNLQAAHDLDGPAQMRFEPADQLAAIVTIAPEHLDLGKALLEWLE